MGERPGGPSGRSAALRDLLFLLGVFFIMVLGSATRLFEPLFGWVDERLRGQVGEAVGGLVLLAGGLSLFALVQGPSNRRESSARHLAESRYQALVEKMPAVIYTRDPRRPAGTTATPYVSPQIEQILGFTAQEWTDDPALWIRRVHDEDRDRVLSSRSKTTGRGVPVPLRHEIFEPFRQGPTASPHSPGTGIGLSLVGMFAELHGGRAWIEDREGGGASFRVFLPGDPADHRTGNGHDRGTPASIASRGRGLDWPRCLFGNTTRSSDASTCRSSRRTGRPLPPNASRPGSRFGCSAGRTTESSNPSCARVRFTPCARRRCARTSPSAGRSGRRRS
jgi:PAS domain-containing protein